MAVGKWRCSRGPEERTSSWATSSSRIWDCERSRLGMFSFSMVVIVASIVAMLNTLKRRF